MKVETTVEVDVADVLSEASLEDLMDALRAKGPEVSHRAEAIHSCFAAVSRGDHSTAKALVHRIFDSVADREAAEEGMRSGRRT